MKTRLSFEDVQQAIADLHRDHRSQLKLESNESMVMFPPTLGNGYVRGIRLREGLDLSVQKYALTTDLLPHGQNPTVEAACASLTFCLSGQFTSTFPGF